MRNALRLWLARQYRVAGRSVQLGVIRTTADHDVPASDDAVHGGAGGTGTACAAACAYRWRPPTALRFMRASVTSAVVSEASACWEAPDGSTTRPHAVSLRPQGEVWTASVVRLGPVRDGAHPTVWPSLGAWLVTHLHCVLGSPTRSPRTPGQQLPLPSLVPRIRRTGRRAAPARGRRAGQGSP